MKKRQMLPVLGLAAGLVAGFWLADKRAAREAATLADELARDVHFCELDEVRLAYRRWGNRGPFLLLLHGMFGSSYDFNQLGAELGQKYQVLALDLPGFGLSEKPADLDYSKKNLARLVASCLDKLGFNSCFLLGHSMGGEIALHLTLSRPGLVQGLILLSSAGWQDIHRGFRQRPPGWLIDHVGQNFLIQQMVLHRVVYNKKYATRSVLLPFYYFNKKIPAAAMQKILHDNDSGQLQKKLAGIKVKSFLLWGEKDKIISLAQGRQLAAHLAGSELVVLEKCGHLPYLEKPADTYRYVQGFLEAMLADSADK